MQNQAAQIVELSVYPIGIMDLCERRKYSAYYNGLDEVAKRRYDQKLDMLPGIVDDNPLFIPGHTFNLISGLRLCIIF